MHDTTQVGFFRKLQIRLILGWHDSAADETEPKSGIHGYISFINLRSSPDTSIVVLPKSWVVTIT